MIYVFYYQNKWTSATEQSSTFPMTRFHAYTWYSLTPDIHGGVIFAVGIWTCRCTFVKQWDGFNPLWSKGSRGKGFLKSQKYWIHNIRSSLNDPYVSHTTYCWFCSKVVVVSVRDFILRFSYFRNGTWMFQVHFSSLGKVKVCTSNWGFFVFLITNWSLHQTHLSLSLPGVQKLCSNCNTSLKKSGKTWGKSTYGFVC